MTRKLDIPLIWVFWGFKSSSQGANVGRSSLWLRSAGWKTGARRLLKHCHPLWLSECIVSNLACRSSCTQIKRHFSPPLAEFREEQTSSRHAGMLQWGFHQQSVHFVLVGRFPHCRALTWWSRRPGEGQVELITASAPVWAQGSNQCHRIYLCDTHTVRRFPYKVWRARSTLQLERRRLS